MLLRSIRYKIFNLVFNHLIWKIKGVSIATKCHHIYQETNIKLKHSLFARV